MSAVEEEIEIRSEEVKDIISYVPSWMIRWGNLLILFLIVLFVSFLYLIKYPDIIVSDIVITTSTPPAKIVARTSGKIEELFVKDGERIEKDEAIGILENPAKTSDVIFVKRIAESFDYNQFNTSNGPFNTDFQLGDIDDAFSKFNQSWKEYYFQIELLPEERQMKGIERQKAEYNILLQKQAAQVKLFEEELAFAKQEFQRNEGLFKQKVLSAREFEEKSRDYIKVKRNLEELKIGLSNTKITLTELDRSFDALTFENLRHSQLLKNKVSENLRQLKLAIAEWEYKYVFKSPISGHVNYFTILAKNLNVREGEEVFSVVPDEEKEIFGKVSSPLLNSGKIKKGQLVNICLDNYPCSEWGTLRGRVDKISLVPQNNKYTVEVRILNNLRTSYNKKLDFRQEMHGEAKIVTEELRLIDRIFYSIRKGSEDKI
jgi:multidrug resistance efflux pump